MSTKKHAQSMGKGEIIIYQPKGGEVQLRVRLERETIWLTQKQIAGLYDCSVDNVNLHLKNIYGDGELNEKSTSEESSIVQIEGERRVKRLVKSYNLDAIISVGYRVNSRQATQFRIWATKTLKSHIIRGYTLNRQRLMQEAANLRQLQQTITFLEKKARNKMLSGQGKELLSILRDYSKTLSLLEHYDKGKIKSVRGRKPAFVLEYDDCLTVIASLKKKLMATSGSAHSYLSTFWRRMVIFTERRARAK